MTEAQKEANEILQKFDGNLEKACQYVSEIIDKGQEHSDFWWDVKESLPCAKLPPPKKKRERIVNKKLTAHENRIYSTMKSLGTFTDTQVKNATGLKATDISPRRRQFSKLGLIEMCGTETNIKGREVIVWKVK